MPVTATTLSVSQSATIPWDQQSLSSSLSCSQRLQRVKEIFLRCGEAKKLWKEVREGGPFKIQCATTDKVPTGLGHFPVSRKILISDTEEKDTGISTHFLLGLIALERNEDTSSVVREKCKVPIEDFVRAMERIQHRTVIRSHEIASACVKEGTWPANWDIFRDEFNDEKSIADFDHFLERQEKSLNSDVQRKNWYRSCAPDQHGAWIAKNWLKWEEAIRAEQKEDL